MELTLYSRCLKGHKGAKGEVGEPGKQGHKVKPDHVLWG